MLALIPDNHFLPDFQSIPGINTKAMHLHNTHNSYLGQSIFLCSLKLNFIDLSIITVNNIDYWGISCKTNTIINFISFDFAFFFNGIQTFLCYLIPKPS